MFDGDDDVLYTSAGTPAFLSPEACTAGQYKGIPSDVWAAGVTLYVMLFGRVPFSGSGIFGTYNSILYEEPSFPDGEDARMIDLLRRIMTKNPDQRITIKEIKCHPWITHNGRWSFAVDFPVSESFDVTNVTEQEIREAIVEGRSMKMLDKLLMMSKIRSRLLCRARIARQRVQRRKLQQNLFSNKDMSSSVDIGHFNSGRTKNKDNFYRRSLPANVPLQIDLGEQADDEGAAIREKGKRSSRSRNLWRNSSVKELTVN